ncbi:MAG: TetR/AcrR family transcriptional regulator [Syntrophomonas sp.]
MDKNKKDIDDRRVRRTKKMLKESLAALLMKKKLNDITVKEIVDLADVNRGTFYLHYRDIYDMLSKIENEMMHEMEDISKRYLNASFMGSPGPYITEMFQYVADNEVLCKMLLGPYGDMAFVEKLKKLVEEKCFNSLMEGCPENELQHYKYFTTYAVSGCVGLLQAWMNDGMKVSPQELSLVAVGMIQNGVEFLERKH